MRRTIEDTVTSCCEDKSVELTRDCGGPTLKGLFEGTAAPPRKYNTTHRLVLMMYNRVLARKHKRRSGRDVSGSRRAGVSKEAGRAGGSRDSTEF